MFSTIVHIETDLMQPENQMYAAENVDSASTKWWLSASNLGYIFRPEDTGKGKQAVHF